MAEEIEYNTDEAKEQFRIMREKQAQDREEVYGAQRDSEKRRLREGGTDFTLYNYILSTHDFKDCPDMATGMRKLYAILEQKIRDIVKENTELRNICGNTIDKMDRTDRKRVLKIMENPADPQLVVAKMMKEIQDRAQARSKAGIKSYQPDQPKIIV